MTENDRHGRRTPRERREAHNTGVSFECDECGLLIEGHTGDPQEAPWLYCPKCDVEMNYAVEP